MGAMVFELLFIVVLTLANGLLAMSEIAIVSARKMRLRQHAADGDQRGQVALQLAAEPTRFLSTVQIGITLVGILAGALGGATIAKELGAVLRRIPFLAPCSEALGLTIVVLGITYLSLVIGELVPKRLALNNAEKLALAVAVPMQRLSTLSSPIVCLLSLSTDAVLRLLGARPSSEPPITEEELALMIDEGTQAGVFEWMERDIVRRVFRLGDRRISNLMTHRTEIVWLDLDDPPHEIVDRMIRGTHSRYPVARGNLDNILGIVQVRDLLAQSLATQPLNLKAILHTPVFVPESAEILDALERFRESRLPMALVTDEYGGLEGLLTINDVLEAIVGDMPQFDDDVEPEAVQRPDGSWLLDGALPIDEFKDIFQFNTLPGETEGHFETLGGFVMAFLGRIPSAADHLEWRGLCLEVMDMDGRRVDKVLVAPLTRSARTETEQPTAGGIE